MRSRPQPVPVQSPNNKSSPNGSGHCLSNVPPRHRIEYCNPFPVWLTLEKISKLLEGTSDHSPLWRLPQIYRESKVQAQISAPSRRISEWINAFWYGHRQVIHIIPQCSQKNGFNYKACKRVKHRTFNTQSFHQARFHRRVPTEWHVLSTRWQYYHLSTFWDSCEPQYYYKWWIAGPFEPPWHWFPTIHSNLIN